MNGAFIWYKNFSSKLFIFVKVHAFDGQTDGRTDYDRRVTGMLKMY